MPNHTTGYFTSAELKSLGLKVYTSALNLQLSTDKPHLPRSMMPDIKTPTFRTFAEKLGGIKHSLFTFDKYLS